MSEKMWNFKGLHNCGMMLIVLWNDRPGASNLLVSQNGENEEAELASAKSIQALSVEITAMGTDIQACFTRRFRPVTC